jgi:branched-chain amino acid transport system substrate-binding protein
MRWTVNARGLALLFLVTASLLGCDGGPINVGFLGALTGRAADLGVAGRDGALLAVEQANQTGGINGHLLALQEFDDQQRPDALTELKPQIAAAKLSGMVGPMTSSMAAQWIPMANELQLLTISPTVTSEDFSKKDDYFFTVTSNTADYASFSANYYVQKSGLKRFSLILDSANSAYSKSWSKHFRHQADALGGAIVSEQEFKSGDNAGLEMALKQAISAQPDGLVFVASAPDVAQLAQMTRRQGNNLPLMAAEWAGSESVWKIVGNGLNGIRFSQFMNVRDNSDKSIHFRNQFKVRFGRLPGFAEFAAFDAMNVLLSSIGQKQPTEPLKAAVIRIGEFSGVQNPIKFDPFGDTKRPIYMVELSDGELHVLQ